MQRKRDNSDDYLTNSQYVEDRRENFRFPGRVFAVDVSLGIAWLLARMHKPWAVNKDFPARNPFHKHQATPRLTYIPGDEAC